MTAPGKAKPVFVSAIVLLCTCAVASYLSFFYFRESERGVSHTQDVRVATGQVDATINTAARERMSYMLTGSQENLTRYRAWTQRLSEQIRTLQGMVADNVQQSTNVTELEHAVQSRLRVWEDTIARKQAGEKIDPVQVMTQNFDLSRRCAEASAQIQANESVLLEQRTAVAHRRFVLASVVMVGSFAVAILLLLFYRELLQEELRLREAAEQTGERGLRERSCVKARRTALPPVCG